MKITYNLYAADHSLVVGHSVTVEGVNEKDCFHKALLLIKPHEELGDYIYADCCC
jgi:hypothetical protein